MFSHQVFLLTEAYFVFTCLVLLLDAYRLELAFMLRVRHFLITKRKFRLALAWGGVALCALNMAFPVYPGPGVIGDFAAAVLCLFIGFYYARYAKEDRRTYLRLSDKTCGLALAAYAVFHFACPYLVVF